MKFYNRTTDDISVLTRREVIDLLLDRDGNVCRYPGCTEILGDKLEITIDHIIPISEARRRGWDESVIHGLDNLGLQSFHCNQKKSDRIPNEDGTLPPRATRRKLAKRDRPPLLSCCRNGRLVMPGNTCIVCGSEAQPRRSPRMLQLSPIQCEHDGPNFCYLCFVGFVSRKDGMPYALPENQDALY